MVTPEVHEAGLAELDARTWHDIVRLRVDVFVVEQECAYAELDGRDAEPGARHLWTSDAAGPTAYLRLLTEPDGSRRVGRVCTATRARRAGLSAALVRRALSVCGADAAVVLDAQSHLQHWYERFGFTVAGPEFVEDDIPHVPMSGSGTRDDTTPGEHVDGCRATSVTVNLPSSGSADDVAFYADVLGLDRCSMDQGWVRRLETSDPAVHLQLVTRDATASLDSAATVGVDDVDAAHSRARAGGHEIVHPLTSEPWGVRRFFVRSPGGAVLNVAAHTAD